MSAAQVSKAMKERGLKRLRWYCQMCEKQCRDDNGFKQHCTTEGHLRKMAEFSAHSGSYTERFSAQVRPRALFSATVTHARTHARTRFSLKKRSWTP